MTKEQCLIKIINNGFWLNGDRYSPTNAHFMRCLKSKGFDIRYDEEIRSLLNKLVESGDIRIIRDKANSRFIKPL